MTLLSILLLILSILLITLPIYYLFFHVPNPQYTPPATPVLKRSLNPLSVTLRASRNADFQAFLQEEGTIRVDIPFAVTIHSFARYTAFNEKFTEVPIPARISSLSSNLALSVPFPYKFSCTELYISHSRHFLGFYSTFDQKIFAVRLSEVVRISNFFPEEDRIWVDCWIHKSLVRFELDVQKGADLLFRTLQKEGLGRLLEVPNRRILIVHNPTSGTGKSKQIFADMTKLYDYVGLKYDAIATKYQGHARDCMKRLRGDNSEPLYDTILAVGGDGTLSEILNGIRDEAPELLTKVAVVPIPAGSGNGVAQALFGCGDDYMVSALAVLHNKRTPMDTILTRFDDASGAPEVQKGTDMLAALSLTIGIVADSDLESEVIRFLGDLRFIIFTVYLTFRYFRTYPMKITMSVDENFQPGKDYLEIAEGQTEITLQDNYYSCIMGNVSYLTKDICAFNFATPNDGYMDVLLIPKTYDLPRLVLIFIAMLGGYVSTQPKLQYFKTKRLVIEPDVAKCPSLNMMIDGEAAKLSRVECRVQQEGCVTLTTI